MSSLTLLKGYSYHKKSEWFQFDKKRDQVDTQLSELGLASTLASENQTLVTVGSFSEN